MSEPRRYDHEVVVIGAGPGGIAAGALLKMAGLRDFAILERAGEVGGSWRDNSYPGIGVDVPALAYQYSFARKPDWQRLFPKGEEVLAYHRQVAKKFGLYRYLRFNTGVAREVWDDERHLWKLHTDDGRIITARFVISAVGAFLKPKHDVGIPGLDDYTGIVQRPASWDHSQSHTGLRVAVIGTGASSVQITPTIATDVASLDVYQRTPVWCLPKPDIELPPWFQRALRLPGVAAALHGGILAALQVGTWGLSSTPPRLGRPVVAAMDAAAKRHYAAYLRRVVADPATAAALTPDYGPVTKRPTISTGYVRAFNRDNVSLLTTPIDKFTANGIRTTDGVERAYDMIVLATGYELFSDPESYRPDTVVGRDGFDLGTFYNQNRLQAYESVALPGLPNRWMLVGPYSWTGTGWHLLVEISATHAIRAITEARRRQASRTEVKQGAHRRYHAEVQRRGRLIQFYFTELNRGVRTYYVNSHGESVYLRPSSVLQARRSSRRFPLDDYRYDTTVDATASDPASADAVATTPALPRKAAPVPARPTEPTLTEEMA
jgi:cation diffusion facilitator CzcD-associated flavoprotein CzcO